MGQAIEITRTDLNAEQLRVLAGRSHDGVFFWQMRHEIADLEERPRNELQGSATQLAAVVMGLETLRLRTSQVLDRRLEAACLIWAAASATSTLAPRRSSSMRSTGRKAWAHGQPSPRGAHNTAARTA